MTESARNGAPLLPPLSLVLGGARSGKSRYAEALVTRLPPSWIYIATAQAFDEEMCVRIDEHRARRNEGWRTIEAPLALAGAIHDGGEQGNAILVDCLTLWLSNLLLAQRGLTDELVLLDAALDAAKVPVVLVSNEVGLGLVPETPLGREFRDGAGWMHQHLAARADSVVFMVAGLPATVK